MKHVWMYLGVMALLLIFTAAQGQTLEKKVIRPILLDKVVLSGLGLKQVKLQHEPDRKFFQRSLYRGEDLSVFIVSSQSWTTRMDNFSIDEYVYIFHGKSRARPDGGEDLYFHTGEHFAIPKGFTGQWEVFRSGRSILFGINPAPSKGFTHSAPHCSPRHLLPGYIL